MWQLCWSCWQCPNVRHPGTKTCSLHIHAADSYLTAICSRFAFPAVGPQDPRTAFKAPWSLAHHRFRNLLKEFSNRSWKHFEGALKGPRLTPSKTLQRPLQRPLQKPFWNPSGVRGLCGKNESLDDMFQSRWPECNWKCPDEWTHCEARWEGSPVSIWFWGRGYSLRSSEKVRVWGLVCYLEVVQCPSAYPFFWIYLLPSSLNIQTTDGDGPRVCQHLAKLRNMGKWCKGHKRRVSLRRVTKDFLEVKWRQDSQDVACSRARSWLADETWFVQISKRICFEAPASVLVLPNFWRNMGQTRDAKD